MTTRQIELVKETWQVFQKIDAQLVGDVLYDKLFNDHPSLRNMFNETRQAQSRKIIAMLSFIVDSINHPTQLAGELHDFAIRHKKYGVKADHYLHLEKALLWMLRQGLGADWNQEIEEAWRECYREISSAMAAVVR